MISGKKILAVIPARGGSKGLKNKNIKPLCGKPLIEWTIQKAKLSKYLDTIVVTTDNLDIANISKDCGAEVPFMRPKNLAKRQTPKFKAQIKQNNTNLLENYQSVLARICSVDGCQNVHKGRGFCDKHLAKKIFTDSKLCTFDGCNNKHKGRGYCDKHLQRLRKWGDVNFVPDPKIK